MCEQVLVQAETFKETEKKMGYMMKWVFQRDGRKCYLIGIIPGWIWLDRLIWHNGDSMMDQPL